MRGAREAPAPRDLLNFRQTSLLSRNECESGTFTIGLQLHMFLSFMVRTSPLKGTCEFAVGIHHASVSSARCKALKARHEENNCLFNFVGAQFGETIQL